MANQNLIRFIKCWNTKDGKYGEKVYWFNPEVLILGMEDVKVKKDGGSIDCTKIIYENHFLTLVGDTASFIKACTEGNTTVCILNDIYREGLTVKDFLKQLEGGIGANIS